MAESTRRPHPSSGNTGSVRADHGGGEAHKAGAFDIRIFIGSLLGIYGVVLVLVGLFSSDGRSINVLTGIGMAVVAVLFVVWARLRPVVVPDDVAADAAADDRSSGH
jgi:hypothetical protein